MTNKLAANPPTKEKKGTLWWEKTVEYKFVLSAKEKFGINILSPLDGDVEAIGDTIAKKNNKYFIIEFKRRPGDFRAEYDKFALNKVGYRTAKIEFNKCSASKNHYVIAGRLGPNAKSLTLCFMNYFNIPVKLPETEVFQTGMNEADLKNYTEKFTAAKLLGSEPSANEEDGDSEGCGGGIHKGTMVLAIDEKNNAVVLPLSFFAGPKPSLTPQNGPGSPSGPQTKISHAKPANSSSADKNDTAYKNADEKSLPPLKKILMRLKKITDENNKKPEDLNPSTKKNKPKM